MEKKKLQNKASKAKKETKKVKKRYTPSGAVMVNIGGIDLQNERGKSRFNSKRR